MNAFTYSPYQGFGKSWLGISSRHAKDESDKWLLIQQLLFEFLFNEIVVSTIIVWDGRITRSEIETSFLYTLIRSFTRYLFVAWVCFHAVRKYIFLFSKITTRADKEKKAHKVCSLITDCPATFKHVRFTKTLAEDKFENESSENIDIN